MQKLKREEPRRAGCGCFVAVWTVVLLVAQFALARLSLEVFLQVATRENFDFVWAAASIVVNLLVAFIQVYLVQGLLKRSMRGWTLTHIVSDVFYWLLYFGFQSTFDEMSRLSSHEGLYLFGILSTLILRSPLIILQGLWLSRRAQRAWLWPLTLILIPIGSAVIMNMLPGATALSTTDAGRNLLSWFIQLASLVILGFVIYDLMTHPNAREIARLEAVDEAKRLAHLRVQEMQSANETVISRVYEEEQAALPEAWRG